MILKYDLEASWSRLQRLDDYYDLEFGGHERIRPMHAVLNDVGVERDESFSVRLLTFVFNYGLPIFNYSEISRSFNSGCMKNIGQGLRD